MVFSSVPFLFYFLPLFIVSYLVARSVKARNIVLLIFSLLFYAWGEPWFVLVMLAAIVGNWQAALLIARTPMPRRLWLTGIAVAGNLSLLVIFKYADFLVGNLNDLTSLGGVTFALPKIALPLGISFFTFHSISYLVDVHRGDAKPATRLSNIAVYISMFPQLVAGPIIRYKKVAKQLDRRRSTWGRVALGARIFVIGLAQKVLIADEVARLADAAFDKAVTPLLADAWIGLSAYTIQIYFDFAGYSNMAIGFAVALGFTFPRNFRLPYKSRSVTEFWRRWHMSLSNWFRDYVYIPMGGNRGSAFETYRNLGSIFLLCGLWHGASWNFVIWGAHHGLLLIIERAGLGKILRRLPSAFSWAYTLLAVMAGWVWFRAVEFSDAIKMFKGLIGLNGMGPLDPKIHIALYPTSLAALVLGAAFALLPHTNATPPIHGKWTEFMRRLSLRYALNDYAFMTVLLALSILTVSSGSYSPFLYFRF